MGILGVQFLWTRDAEIALSNARSDRKIMNTTDMKFLDILNILIDVTTQNLSKIERRKFETLITIHLHQRDILHDLVSQQVMYLSSVATTGSASTQYLQLAG